MAVKINAIRGMNDILPGQSNVWQQVEKVLKQQQLLLVLVKLDFL